MFHGLKHERINVGDATINLRHGGSGPPLLLLHGFPQTHVHWHATAPLLAEDFTLVIPDLRGYGDSSGPPPDTEHLNYSKRAMARDMIDVMDGLGHKEFRVAGHDRGARVAYRLTLDHPDSVSHLISLDTVPTLDIWDAMDMSAAIEAFHWPFMAQPAPVPETLIGNAPDFFLNHLLDRWAGESGALDREAVEHYTDCFRKPEVIRAMAEDYRAGATIDLEHDRKDRSAGKRIACPMFVLRGVKHTPEPLGPTWLNWADDVSESEIDCGHFIAEEAPDECAAAMRGFLLK